MKNYARICGQFEYIAGQIVKLDMESIVLPRTDDPYMMVQGTVQGVFFSCYIFWKEDEEFETSAVDVNGEASKGTRRFNMDDAAEWVNEYVTTYLQLRMNMRR
jgi:hypothetical protein